MTDTTKDAVAETVAQTYAEQIGRAVLEAAAKAVWPWRDQGKPDFAHQTGEWEKWRIGECIRALDLAAIIASVPEPAPWQDIATAPESNGSVQFLAYIPGHGQHVCVKIAGEIRSAGQGHKLIPMAKMWQPLPPAPAPSKENLND